MTKKHSLGKKMQPELLRDDFDLEKFHNLKDNKTPIPKMYSDSFDWIRWREGIAIWRELGIACRLDDIVAQAKVLRHYAIGYLPGKSLICRPKEDEIAVMFLIDDDFCWTHLRKEEFENVFIIE